MAALAQTLKKVGFHIRSLSPFHFEKGTSVPHEDHLCGARSIFLAPWVNAEILMSTLAQDFDFQRCIPQLDIEYVLRCVVIGDELRANVYRVEEDPTLNPLFNPNWFNEGEFAYLLDRDPIRGITPVCRKVPGKYYHPKDPVVSFTLQLTGDLLKYVEANRKADRHVVPVSTW